jgi:hypothetical protein
MKIKILLFVMMVLTIFALAGCESEMDQPFVPPVPGNPIVDIHSNPDADVSVFELGESDKNLAYSGHTPVIGLELKAASYAVVFSKEGYESKAYGLRLALGDTNVVVNQDLDVLPVDPPEPEELWATLELDPAEIQLGDELNIHANSNGLLGIIEPMGIFTQDGPYSFAFVPQHAGEGIVSFAVIGEDGQYLVRREAFYVHPADSPTPTLNAWASAYQVPAGTTVNLHWASTGADSVTIEGYANSANIGDSGLLSVEIFSSSTFIFQAWSGGGIATTKAVSVQMVPVVLPNPELTFYASAAEISSDNPDWLNYQTGVDTEVWLVWNVKFYDEATDLVGIDRFPTYGDLGPHGLMPVTVHSDTTFTATVYRSDNQVMWKTVHISVVDNPPPVPSYFEVAWDLDKWVGARNEDPHQVDLVSGLSLPESTRIQVWAKLAYSSEYQINETGAIGGISASHEERWAFLDDPSCPVFPDQGTDVVGTYFIGVITGFREGKLVLRHGVDFPCWTGNNVCPPTNPNSLWIQRLELRVWLN